MFYELIDSIKDRHIDKPISPEAYHLWRESGVTCRLMDELKVKLLECLTADFLLSNCDEIAMSAVTRQAIKDSFETVIYWKPQELITDED